MQFIVLAMEELERQDPDWEECNRVTGVTVLKLMVVNSLKLMVMTFQGYI